MMKSLQGVGRGGNNQLATSTSQFQGFLIDQCHLNSSNKGASSNSSFILAKSRSDLTVKAIAGNDSSKGAAATYYNNYSINKMPTTGFKGPEEHRNSEDESLCSESV